MKKAIAVGLISAAVESRKQLVKPSGKRINNPKVEATSKNCDPACLFEDDDKKNYWCLDFTDPHVKMGWEWLQDFAETDDSPAREYLEVDLRFYVETSFNSKSTFNVPRLYFNEFKLELEEFKAYIWFRETVNQDFQLCSGIGWGNEQIDLVVEMMQKLAQCYKILINDTCSFEDVWYGRNAKIFEGCELSQDGSDEKELEFYTYEWKPKKEDRTWIGTSKPYSDTYCKPLPLIGKTTAGGVFNSNMKKWAESVYGLAATW